MDYNYKGLNDEEVLTLQNKYGKNEISKVKKETFFIKLISVITEPMFLLLIVASIIYFILGEPKDGFVMLIFITGMISIDIINEWKTDKTLASLKELSSPKINVIRNNREEKINSINLVPKDLMIIHEGVKIPADGIIIKCNGLKVDESSLTGESEYVLKKEYSVNDQDKSYFKNNYCYAGTLVVGGTAKVIVDKIGSKTEYGKIGSLVAKEINEKTPLQKQIDKLVKVCAIIAFVLFIIVCFITYIKLSDHIFKDRIIESILSGITLAMAMIPEEFPVVLTVFLSMGAWRLAKKNSLVKKLSSVETLGAVSVLCVDKTGTITKNEMTISDTWNYKTSNEELYLAMGLSCLENSYDPMEKAMLNYCYNNSINSEILSNKKIVKEYPFSNDNKLMGYIINIDNKFTLNVKGSYESLLAICELKSKEKELIIDKVNEMSSRGLRVIAVGKKELLNDTSFKENLMDEKISFLGLIGLIDPPRDNIKEDIDICKNAGIRIIMITGDNGITARAICNKIGIDSDNIITGNEIDKLNDNDLCDKVKITNIFSRVTPEHKLRIVKALKDNGEIVAMTGDGVNDAPALKYSDIGIAMGKRGTEVSREAADLILMDDNFSTIVSTIKDGRRIYDNIKKAIGYIFIIHIPIALSALLSPILGFTANNLFLLPIHIVLLEMIIDPTCSIVLERQLAENNIMKRSPRNKNDNLLTLNLLCKSIIQGLIIFIGSFITYYIVFKTTNNILIARSMGLTIIILSNLFLVYVNSSNTSSAFNCFIKLLNDKVMWLVNILSIIGIIFILYSPLNKLLKLGALNITQVLIVIGVSFISVFWYELVKIILLKNKLK